MTQSPNDEERNQRAERWLESALDRYVDAEPRPGFETRLLATVAAERDRRSRWRSVWTWAAVGAAAVVLVAIALSVGRNSEVAKRPVVAQSTPPTRETTVATAAPPQPATAQPRAARLEAARNKVRKHTRPTVVLAKAQQRTTVAGPQQPQFPAPAPLSEQERLLLAYVQSTPKTEIEAVVAQKQAFQEEFDKLGVPQPQEKSER